MDNRFSKHSIGSLRRQSPELRFIKGRKDQHHNNIFTHSHKPDQEQVQEAAMQ